MASVIPIMQKQIQNRVGSTYFVLIDTISFTSITPKNLSSKKGEKLRHFIFSRVLRNSNIYLFFDPAPAPRFGSFATHLLNASTYILQTYDILP
jgi:hypothetical protein